MECQYVLTKTIYVGYTTYGIAYVEYDDHRPILIETYPDLSSEMVLVEDLVERCNHLLQDHYQLRDIVEDFLGSI